MTCLVYISIRPAWVAVVAQPTATDGAGTGAGTGTENEYEASAANGSISNANANALRSICHVRRRKSFKN